MAWLALVSSRTVARLACLVLLVAAPAGAAGERKTGTAGCPVRQLEPGYAARVTGALRSGKDLWGNALLAAPSGPTYEGARRYLKPLLLAGGPGHTALTDSGVHYVAFAHPLGPQGAGSVALHVADGGQIASDGIDGRKLTILVGARERYGSCLVRLSSPRLAGGYLPILSTSYVDAQGTRYRQESFAARIAQTGSLVSFVRLTIDAARATAPNTRVRFVPSVTGLARDGNRLRRGRATHLVFGEGGTFDGSSVSYSVRRGSSRIVYAAWINYPEPTGPLVLDEAAYERARTALVAHWERRLDEGATFQVPEQHVGDALRNLLIQNLALTWRYSIGNPYEQFSFPESVDVAQVIAEYGFGAVARSILRTSLTRKPTPYPNWKMGERLVGSALHYALHRDRAFVRQVTPTLRRYVATLGGQLATSSRGLLHRERYSSDIPDSVYGLHSQAVVWQGLRSIARVWADTGDAASARAARTIASRLEPNLRTAVRASQKRLPDGSLFIPAQLLDGVEPYGALTSSRLGSYWNLVMPYALASGLFRPGSPEATGVLRYMLRHGSRLLGLVRAGAYALYPDPVFPASGTDQVYGINVARFLADQDEPDQLALSLYGHLAAGMTEGTFVSGEAASVAPLRGAYYRSMYLPPNGASNAAFLATLRLMLVHETTERDGGPLGLELAFATPRAWLRPGKRIVVRDAPTSFGALSYSLEADASSVRASVEVPEREPPRTLALRIRLPRGQRITGVTLNGRPYARVDRARETVDLSGRTGRLELVVGYARRAP